MKLDIVTLEVVRNVLPAIANEMSYVLQRTSHNMMIYEVRDYCCGLLDARGRLLSCALTPVARDSFAEAWGSRRKSKASSKGSGR